MVSSAYAHVPKVDDQYKMTSKMSFFETDYTGFLDIIDLWQDRVNLEKGNIFTVIENNFDCGSQLHTGKYLRHCSRDLVLEATDCGLADTPVRLEQIVARSTHFTLFVENGVCTVRVYDKVFETIFETLDAKKVNKRSKFKNYFVKLK